MRTVTIVGAIASATGVTLYIANGDEINLDAANYRTKNLMDDITPKLTKNRSVTVDLDDYSAHAQVERKTNGVIRFFKNKIDALASLFKNKQDEPVVVGNTEPYGASSIALSLNSETVAVVDDKIIPDVHHLEAHIEHAATTGNTVGLENFMKRIAAVIDNRGHSVQELMNFMKRGDLPIAEDGCIVAYKVLTSYGQEEGTFVDCHTKNVKQRVGSRVVMDEKLVDPDRRTECSTGLHIARRGYLSGFGGDIITLVKVAPEDVIAVPFSEPDKMRAAAYHIVALLPSRVYQTLRHNKPMTGDAEASQILADVIAGKHVGVLEEVRIHSAQGGDVVITPLDTSGQSIEPPKVSGEAKALDDKPAPSPLSIKELNKKIAEVRASEPAPAPAEESAKDRRNRIKREKRAALRADKITTDKVTAPPTDKIRQAAMFGSMAAALSQPAVAEPVSEKQPEKVVDTSDREALVLKLHREGKSSRAIEKELKMCRKTIKKILDKHAA